jgi:hypothetical protein
LAFPLSAQWQIQKHQFQSKSKMNVIFEITTSEVDNFALGEGGNLKNKSESSRVAEPRLKIWDRNLGHTDRIVYRVALQLKRIEDI